MDPDPDKKYTRAFQISKESADSNMPSTQLQSHLSANSKLDSWPKGPYSQQMQGILPPILADDIILTHLQISGKQLKPQKHKMDNHHNYCILPSSVLKYIAILQYMMFKKISWEHLVHNYIQMFYHR